MGRYRPEATGQSFTTNGEFAAIAVIRTFPSNAYYRPIADLQFDRTASMKNIQVIDGAVNCVYDIFAATDEEFALIFPEGQDIAFVDEVYERVRDDVALNHVFEALWARRVVKAHAIGIHGQLFFELKEKKVFYPTRRDEEAENPGGYRLR